MKALVCGGRKFGDYPHLCEVLSTFENNKGEKITLIIHGGASGADALAALWAKDNSIPVLPFPITDEEWKKYGDSAGPRRNEQMLRKGKPDVVIAFPGNFGTSDMITQARAARVTVVVIK